MLPRSTSRTFFKYTVPSLYQEYTIRAIANLDVSILNYLELVDNKAANVRVRQCFTSVRRMEFDTELREIFS